MSRVLPIFLFVLLLLPFFTVPGHANPSTSMYVSPASKTVNVGATFSIDVDVADVVNTTCWQFTLDFDKTVLQCTTAAEGPFLKSGGGTYFYKSINNANGYVLLSSALMGMNVQVSGSGVLATVTFNAVAAGQSTLHLHDTLLGDTQIPPVDIPHSVSDGTVYVQAVQRKLTVSSAHDTPSPANGDTYYNDGQSVTCSVSSLVTEGSTVWTCTGWSGTGSVPSSGSSTSVTFTISQDSTITWNWQGTPVQRKLTVSSAHDSPSPSNGDHFYNDGASITCSVTSPVTEASITYVCTGRSGTGSVPSSGTGTSTGSFTIYQDSSITWNWAIVQRKLTVSSAHDSPNPSVGDHLYNDGSSVTCSVTSPVTEGSTIWTCTGWSGTGSVPSSGSGTSVTFTISQNSTITWNWQGTPIQRKLTVSSTHDTPVPSIGDHYYNDGQSVTCSVTSPVTEGSTVWTCTGWSGTGSVPASGSGSSVTFTISQDSTITWNWQGTPVQRKLTVSTAHDSPSPPNGDSFYSDGASVACSVTSPVTEGGVTYVCTGWSGMGSVPASGTGSSVTFTITQNSSITWNWALIQRKLTVNSAHDTPNPSNGDHYYSDGQSVTCSVTSPVTEGSTVWTCTGWSGTGSVPSSGSGKTVTFTISQDSTIMWNWQGQVNQPPVASDLQISPSSPKKGDSLTASYTYYDADGDPEGASEIRWYMNSVLQSAYNNVKTVPGSATAKGQTWYFTVRPYDGIDFGTLQTSPSVTVQNSPPVASNLAITPSSPKTTDNLAGSYSYSDVDGDAESGSEIRWYKDGVLQSAYNDAKTIPSSATSKGEVWYFTVRPKDGADFGTLQTSLSVTIQNSPPVGTSLSISPSSPKTTDNFVGSYVFSDADGDPESGSEIRWYKNGVVQSAYNDVLTVSASATNKGEVWYFTVRPKDGTDFGTLQTSPSVTIQNTPPEASSLAITPSSPKTTDNLVASYSYSDADGDAESASEIRWYKDGALQPAYNDAKTVLSSATAKGQTWYFTVKPKDGEDFGELKTSASVTISNTPPVASNLAITPSSPKTIDNLVGSYAYSDVDGDAESGSEIRWYKNGVLQPAYNDLLTVPSSGTSAGESWYFTVRPKDGTDFGDIRTSPSVTIIQNTPPEASNLLITPSTPYTTDNLVGSYTYFDANGDAEDGSEIRWYKNGVLQPAYNNVKTVPSSATSKGESWYFTVKPKDGLDFGILRTSPSVNIQNSLPVASGLSISPSSPKATDNLFGSCSYSDADGDPESGSEIRWYKNGALQPAYNDLKTVPSSVLADGQVWYFTVRPKDGGAFGSLKQSPSVTIGRVNSAPDAFNLTISPAKPYTTDNLVGNYSYYDYDGDPESGTEIRWYNNGVLQPVFNDKLMIPSNAIAQGESWYFTVRPKDGKDFGVLQTSPSVTILVRVDDVAIMDIIPSKVYMYRGHSESFRILVQNKGMMTEIFNVTLRVNNTIINTQTVTLTGGDSTNITISWDTTGFNYGNYTVVAYAEPVQYETLTDDNACRSWIFLTIPGDINHDFTVDIYDAILLAGAFNSRSSDSHWNADADINGDYLVDIYDAIMLAGHYGEKPA